MRNELNAVGIIKEIPGDDIYASECFQQIESMQLPSSWKNKASNSRSKKVGKNNARNFSFLLNAIGNAN